MNSHDKVVNPEVSELIELGNGLGGTIIGGPEKGSVRRDLIGEIKAAQERSKRYAPLSHRQSCSP